MRSQFSLGIDILGRFFSWLGQVQHVQKLNNDNLLLIQAGLGLLWNQAMGIDNLFLRLDYGFPFIDTERSP